MDGDVPPLPRQIERDGPPDALAGPCDQGRFPLDLDHGAIGTLPPSRVKG